MWGRGDKVSSLILSLATGEGPGFGGERREVGAMLK